MGHLSFPEYFIWIINVWVSVDTVNEIVEGSRSGVYCLMAVLLMTAAVCVNGTQ